MGVRPTVGGIAPRLGAPGIVFRGRAIWLQRRRNFVQSRDAGLYVRTYGQSGRFAAVELPLMPLEPLPLVLEPDAGGGDPAGRSAAPPEAPVLLLAPGVPVLAAVFIRAWPVVLSLQWVAAETFALPPADGTAEGEGVD
jgi:hypothetical protein